MTTSWNARFAGWAQPPSDTEKKRIGNAISVVRNAIDGSDALRGRGIRVFPQGSYRNRVNVRQDSDVDIGVLCSDVFFADYPSGKSGRDFGVRDADYLYSTFKNDVEQALVSYLGAGAVRRGNKALDVHETSYHVEADVVPVFEYRQYLGGGRCRYGVELRPDSGGRIQNYPERLLTSWTETPLHYENGVSKNTATGRRYKGVVRILKKLRNEMEDGGEAAARPIPGFLIESMLWNLPDSCFGGETWMDRIQDVFGVLWLYTMVAEKCRGWTEVNGIKFLFHESQPWSREQAHRFINAAWSHVGVLKK